MKVYTLKTTYTNGTVETNAVYKQFGSALKMAAFIQRQGSLDDLIYKSTEIIEDDIADDITEFNEHLIIG